MDGRKGIALKFGEGARMDLYRTIEIIRTGLQMKRPVLPLAPGQAKAPDGYEALAADVPIARLPRREVPTGFAIFPSRKGDRKCIGAPAPVPSW